MKAYIDNNIGLISDGEYYIKLKITYPYARGFREFKWLENEAIEDYIYSGYIIYEAKARGKKDMMGWIMGMGIIVK